MWMGGTVPLGYRVEARKLVVVDKEAELVRRISSLLRRARLGAEGRPRAEHGRRDDQAPAGNGVLRGGRAWTKGAIYKILGNRIYLGQAVHKGTAYPGEHAAIVDQELWDRAHGVMAEPTRQRAATSRAQVPMLLKGLIFGPNGRAMSPSHTKRRGSTHRYYVAREAIAEGYDSCPVKSVPAADVEAAVLAQVQRLLTTPEMIARTWTAAKSGVGRAGGAGPARRLRQPVGRAVPGRAGADHEAAGRAGRRASRGAGGAARAEGLASLIAELRQQPHRQGRLSVAREPPRRRHPGGPHPDAARQAARPQAHPGARRRRADPADQATAGQRAGQGAGPGMAVAKAARRRGLRLGDRDRRDREDQQAAMSAESSASPCWRRTSSSPSSAAGPISGSCCSGWSSRCRSAGRSSGCSSMPAEPRARATPGASAAERQRRRRQKLRLERELQFVRRTGRCSCIPSGWRKRPAPRCDCCAAWRSRSWPTTPPMPLATVELDQLDVDTYRVGDQGPGLDRQQVMALFAVNRPLTSSKLLRRPTRGAIGNGLRVVTGAAMASDGELLVESRGQALPGRCRSRHRRHRDPRRRAVRPRSAASP